MNLFNLNPKKMLLPFLIFSMRKKIFAALMLKSFFCILQDGIKTKPGTMLLILPWIGARHAC
jgi:hypothetical protein